MSEPTHIAVVLDNSFTSDLRVEKEINSLLHAGFRVTLFCFKEEGLAERETQANGLKIVRILDTWLTHPLRRGYTSGLKRTADAIISTSPQAIHCHDMYTLPIGGMLKRTHPQLTFVYDSHEYFRESRYYQDAPGWINRFGGKNASEYSLLKRELKSYRKKRKTFIKSIFLRGADGCLP